MPNHPIPQHILTTVYLMTTYIKQFGNPEQIASHDKYLETNDFIKVFEFVNKLDGFCSPDMMYTLMQYIPSQVPIKKRSMLSFRKTEDEPINEKNMKDIIKASNTILKEVDFDTNSKKTTAITNFVGTDVKNTMKKIIELLDHHKSIKKIVDNWQNDIKKAKQYDVDDELIVLFEVYSIMQKHMKTIHDIVHNVDQDIQESFMAATNSFENFKNAIKNVKNYDSSALKTILDFRIKQLHIDIFLAKHSSKVKDDVSRTDFVLPTEIQMQSIRPTWGIINVKEGKVKEIISLKGVQHTPVTKDNIDECTTLLV